MNDAAKGATTLAVTLTIGVVIGLALGWKIYRPKKTQEAYAPPIVQKDGSIVIEKNPNAKLEPKQIIPKGAVVERVIHVEIEPLPMLIPGSNGTDLPAQPLSSPCSEVTLDMTIVRMENGRRVIVSSPNGRILKAIDVPYDSRIVKDLKWSAGAIVGYKSIGAYVERDIGPFRLGGEINRISRDRAQEWDGRLKVGVRF